MTIVRFDAAEGGLSVAVHGGATRFYSWRWLFDHSDDPASVDPASLQRQVDTFAIPEGLRAAAEIVDAGERLVLRWNDGSETSCSAGLFDGMCRGDGEATRRLWCAPAQVPDGVRFAFDEVSSCDEALRSWLDALVVLGFAIVVDMPADEDHATLLAHRIGLPRSSIFGSMWRLESDMNDHRDSAYSTTFLEPHTDATYMVDAPGTQLFCCLERSGTGGESILVDGFAVCDEMRRDDPAMFETLCQVMVPGRYVEPGVHLRAQRPPIRLSADGEPMQLSFNNYDRAPFWLPEPEMSRFYEAYGALHARIMDPQRWVEVRLEAGDALVFDNWRVLHGRRAYRGRRVFFGCYHNREDVESRRRVLAEGG